MDDFHRTTLGRTGLPVCRLGVACSYGAPAEAFEEAFDHGVNYFYFGGRRTGAMAQAVQNILSRGDRDHLIILIQSYSRSASLMELFLTATRWGDLLNPRRMPAHQGPLTATDCYRFVLSNPSVDVYMTGPRTRGHMREALEALEPGPLSSEEMARVRLIGDHVHATSRRLSFG
jgi:hypothetical protein